MSKPTKPVMSREQYEAGAKRAQALLSGRLDDDELAELGQLQRALEAYEAAHPHEGAHPFHRPEDGPDTQPGGVIQSDAIAPPANPIKRPPWERKT